MEGERTTGRQKIPLEKIEKEANRYASFSNVVQAYIKSLQTCKRM